MNTSLPFAVRLATDGTTPSDLWERRRIPTIGKNLQFLQIIKMIDAFPQFKRWEHNIFPPFGWDVESIFFFSHTRRRQLNVRNDKKLTITVINIVVHMSNIVEKTHILYTLIFPCMSYRGFEMIKKIIYWVKKITSL